MSWRSRIVGHDRVDPETLTGNPLNHRTHPVEQREVVRDSITEFGFVKSVLVNKTTGFIVDGHERVWQALNAKENDPSVLVDVEYVELSEAEEAAVLAVLDASTEMAVVDPMKLDELLREVNTESQAIADMLTELAEESGALDLGATAEIEDIEPQIDRASELSEEWGTAEGQLWIIKGKKDHRLLCGDSTKREDVERLMGGETADLIFTSPPYGQQRDYDTDSKVDCSDWDALMNGVFGNLPANDKTQVLVNLGLIHRDCEWVPYWDKWIEFMRSDGWRRFGWYVWDQGAGLPGDWNGRLAPSFEFVFHFNKEAVKANKTEKCKFAGEQNHGTGLRAKDGEVKGYTAIGEVVQPFKIQDATIRVCRHKARGIECCHAAVYPVGLPEFAMKGWGGDTYDPFLGSGTTMLAAEQLNRRCFGMEISPKYVAVILQRMKDAGCECSLAEG